MSESADIPRGNAQFDGAEAAAEFGYFDPNQPIAELHGSLPHWRQSAVTYFVTFRLADSLPQVKLDQWRREREDWLRRHPEPRSPAVRRDYFERFVARFHRWLDAGYGECVLIRPEVRDILVDALKHFDAQRYALGDWVVLPNHAHALVTPLGDVELSKVLHTWKSYSASEINRLLGRRGQLWQKESFDHIVRSPEAAERIRQYIRTNPAGLPPGSYSLSSLK
ncbi:MAG TPA: transposase [Pirellulales bacterium]|nr:transposase [Pirellulales bacterium]